MEEHTHPEHHHAPEKKELAITPVQATLLNGCIIALAVIMGALIVHGTFDGGAKNGAAAGAAAPVADIAKIKSVGEPFIGNPSAKAAIAYWSDFQCPYCKKFETTVLPDIVKKYVASGEVAIVFKDYSILGADSDTAALYGRAVWNLYPSHYFAWRTAMFNAQDDENQGFGDEASVVKLTGTIAGIDAAKVRQDVESNKSAYMTAIDADRTEGMAFGIKGTPSFITGKELLPGFTAYSAFAHALDKQLN